MKGKIGVLVSISTVVIALGFLVYTGLSDNMVYYYIVDEFIQKAPVLDGETIKINGIVADNSIQKSGMDYSFLIHGRSKDHVKIQYHGVVPDTFRDGAEVVVEGTYDAKDQVFQCTNVLAKCPTKYDAAAKKS